MEILYFDVVTVGAGGGGCIAAITASEQGARVALISKGLIGYGNTRISGGNIAGVGFQKDDNPEIFFQNILESGDFIGEKSVIKQIAEDAIKVPEILENLGVAFKRNQEGFFDNNTITRRGGHSHRRSLFTTSKGIAFGNVLEMSIAHNNINIFEEMVAVKLIKNNNYISGIICFDLKSNKIVYFKCNAVVLATGGGSWMYYPHTTNIKEATGEGYSMAISAGAELMNMEMVQFQPFGLAYPPHLVGLPCGEPAHAGPNGRLVAGNKKKVILEKLNKMTRAGACKEVALAIKKGLGTVNGGLFLDLSGNLLMEEPAKSHYLDMLGGPGGILYRVRFALGEKAAKLEEPWEIAPTAHFFMGGVVTDKMGFSGINGLYCIGEVNGTVHGANRLGTVALTEIFVMGIKSGLMAAEEEEKKHFPNIKPDKPIIEVLNKELFVKFNSNGKYHPINMIREIQNMMWKYAGPVKCEDELMVGIQKLQEIKCFSQNLIISDNTNYNSEIRDLIELDGMIKIAEIIMNSALIRKESRGAHVRSDFVNKLVNPYQTIALYEDNKLKINIKENIEGL